MCDSDGLITVLHLLRVSCAESTGHVLFLYAVIWYSSSVTKYVFVSPDFFLKKSIYVS